MGAIPRQTASARRTKGTSLCMLSSQLTRVTCSVTDDPAAGRPLKPVLEQKECTATLGGADNVFARGPETLCPLRCYGSRPSSAPHCFIDRKSTRLNSSHVRISYAVCCLKKKE